MTNRYPIQKNENWQITKEIISKIKDFINYKNLENLADKLPSERKLKARKNFEVTLNNVKKAIQSLEFYELLKSLSPQERTSRCRYWYL